MMPEQIRVNVTDQEAEMLLHDLVTAVSPSYQEQDSVQLLVDWMANHHYDDAFVDEAGNAVGIRGQGAHTMVLLGHIDTFGGIVPLREEGRILYGRGTVDAKGPLCTFAVAGARADLPEDVRLVVIGAVEEEAPTSKGARHAVTQYEADLCIIGEPSQWDRITLGYKGRLLLRWRWEGALAHSASAVMSPPEHAFAYWQRVRDHADAVNAERKSVFGQLDATLQEINSGQNGAYGWAEMVIGFRLPPDIDPHQLADEFADESEYVTIEPFGHEVACVADKDTGLSRVMRKAIRGEGGKPRFVHKTGTSDMNIVAPIWNCPIVAYGPGDSSLDHTPDEHIDLDEYLRAIAVLTTTLESIEFNS